MADISVTAANVLAVDGDTETLNAGEVITAGQCLYKNATTSAVWKAQCDDAANDDFYGIALNNAAGAGQPVKVLRSGTVTIGGTVTVGTLYVVSATAGGICPWADLVSTNYVTVIGVGTTTGRIRMLPYTSSVQIP